MVQENITVPEAAPVNLLGEGIRRLVDQLEPFLRQRLTNIPATVEVPHLLP